MVYVTMSNERRLIALPANLFSAALPRSVRCRFRPGPTIFPPMRKAISSSPAGQA